MCVLFHLNLHHIKIQNRLVGDNYEPLIIAEIGINHNGNLSIAKKLVDAAYKAGAEVIKHQTHVVEDEMTEEAKKIIPSHSVYAVNMERLMSRLYHKGRTDD